MKRPSRGDRLSAATTRYDGCLVLPTRIRRSFTAICSCLLVEAGVSRGQLRHHLPALALLLHLLRAEAAHLLHHPLHLLELLDEAVDVGCRRAAPVGDPQAPTS